MAVINTALSTFPSCRVEVIGAINLAVDEDFRCFCRGNEELLILAEFVMIAIRVKDIQEGQVVISDSREDVRFLLAWELDTVVSGNYQPFVILCQTHVLH